MTGPPRDWDKELAEIDKIIAKQPLPGSAAGGAGAPPVPATRAAPATAAAARPAALPPPPARRAVLTTWIAAALGVIVAVGVSQWPYQHACGLALYGYLAAAGGVALVGLWGAATAWRRRVGPAHTIALLVALFGGLLVGKAVLDRSGYVKQPATWACP